MTLTTVEKVLFLQGIEVFEHLETEDLAHIAAVTELETFEAGHTVYREGELSDSMYIVVEGSVRLTRGGEEVMTASEREAFGTWALFDDELRVATATTADPSALLRLDKEDFLDLLADHVQITQGIFKGLVNRLRNLIESVHRG
jgi:CRP/FNR family transcriptional regulator/CRP/FNR family cyclic AMP-dependent transcriptional regulator